MIFVLGLVKTFDSVPGFVAAGPPAPTLTTAGPGKILIGKIFDVYPPPPPPPPVVGLPAAPPPPQHSIRTTLPLTGFTHVNAPPTLIGVPGPWKVCIFDVATPATPDEVPEKLPAEIVEPS
jgi:hypothetical protein